MEQAIKTYGLNTTLSAFVSGFVYNLKQISGIRKTRSYDYKLRQNYNLIKVSSNPKTEYSETETCER